MANTEEEYQYKNSNTFTSGVNPLFVDKKLVKKESKKESENPAVSNSDTKKIFTDGKEAAEKHFSLREEKQAKVLKESSPAVQKINQGIEVDKTNKPVPVKLVDKASVSSGNVKNRVSAFESPKSKENNSPNKTNVGTSKVAALADKFNKTSESKGLESVKPSGDRSNSPTRSSVAKMRAKFENKGI